MVFANGLVFFTHVGKVWIAKVENAAFGTLLYRAFDVILTFFAQFIFFEVKDTNRKYFSLINVFTNCIETHWYVQHLWSHHDISSHIDIRIF